MTVTPDPVLAFSTARNNAELIAQAAQLGYVGDGVLDATYGLGRFWKLHQPAALTTNDNNPDRAAACTFDFRRFPAHWAASFDTVVFDPPYKLNGTGGSHPSDGAYGVAWTGIARDDKMRLACDGATECIRVCKVGGHLLWKCQDQVEGGRVRWQTRIFADHVDVAAPLDGPLKLTAVFRLPMPNSRSKTVRARGYAPCSVKPDLDKLVRGLLDGLKHGGLIRDDARVCEITATKMETVDWTGAAVSIGRWS